MAAKPIPVFYPEQENLERRSRRRRMTRAVGKYRRGCLLRPRLLRLSAAERIKNGRGFFYSALLICTAAKKGDHG